MWQLSLRVSFHVIFHLRISFSYFITNQQRLEYLIVRNQQQGDSPMSS
jgi:hypothetical protein